MTQSPDLRRCGACYQPQTGHGTRYAAGIGDHEWTPDPWRPPGSRPAPERWSTTAIPHPAGGVTYPRSPEEHQRRIEEYQRHLEDTAAAEPPPEPDLIDHGPDAVHYSLTTTERWWRRILGTTEGTP